MAETSPTQFGCQICAVPGQTMKQGPEAGPQVRGALAKLRFTPRPQPGFFQKRGGSEQRRAPCLLPVGRENSNRCFLEKVLRKAGNEPPAGEPPGLGRPNPVFQPPSRNGLHSGGSPGVRPKGPPGGSRELGRGQELTRFLKTRFPNFRPVTSRSTSPGRSGGPQHPEPGRGWREAAAR